MWENFKNFVTQNWIKKLASFRLNISYRGKPEDYLNVAVFFDLSYASILFQPQAWWTMCGWKGKWIKIIITITHHHHYRAMPESQNIVAKAIHNAFSVCVCVFVKVVASKLRHKNCIAVKNKLKRCRTHGRRKFSFQANLSGFSVLFVKMLE